MPTTAEALAEVPLFRSLDDRERALLAERVDILPLEEGATLFEAGEPGDWMCIVKSGVVELTVRTKTGEHVFLERAATGKRLRYTAGVLRNAATRNVNEQVEAKANVIVRAADWVASFSGSITFLILHVVIFTAWILLNVGILAFGDFDPYPFGLLTMAVSLEAILLSTLLLFSSNRQVARDKIRSDIEYDVNLKAELQIQHLHEKEDRQDPGADPRPARRARSPAGAAGRDDRSAGSKRLDLW